MASPTPSPGTQRHPSVTALLRWFASDHLPDQLRDVSAPVGDLAHEMTIKLADSPELTAGLRHLLEAKDCFVRAAIYSHEDAPSWTDR